MKKNPKDDVIQSAPHSRNNSQLKIFFKVRIKVESFLDLFHIANKTQYQYFVNISPKEKLYVNTNAKITQKISKYFQTLYLRTNSCWPPRVYFKIANISQY